MNSLAPRVRTALWWLAPLAVLAVLIGWEVGWGGAIRKQPSPEAPATPKPVTLALMPEYSIAGGVAARTETVTRTLFNPTRRQAAIVADASKARMQRGQFALTGTTMIDGKSTAFLRETAGGKSRRVQQGEVINGLTVAEVKADRVRLALGDESEELVLRVATNPRPTAQPALPVPTPAGAAPVPPTATPPQPVAQPAAGGDGATQSLAARRAAARAAANAAHPAQAPGVAPPIAPTPTPAGVAQPPAAAPAAAPDSGWLDMYRRYAQPVQPLVPK